MKYVSVVALGAVVGSLVSYQVYRRLSAEMPLVQVVNEPAQAAAVIAPGSKPDRSEEIERLARENADLKAELEAARARMVERDATLKQTKEQLDELRRPMDADILSSTLRAELKSGEVVVTGGYKLADGRRLYAFAKPVIHESDGVKAVKIEGRYLTLTDEAGKSVGLDNLATNAANTLQHGEVWVPGEEESVLTQLGMIAGTEVTEYPALSVLPGSSGTISVGDIRLKVTPTLPTATDGLGLELRLEQPQQSTEIK